MSDMAWQGMAMELALALVLGYRFVYRDGPYQKEFGYITFVPASRDAPCRETNL
jgi:hypothetical protein